MSLETSNEKSTNHEEYFALQKTHQISFHYFSVVWPRGKCMSNSWMWKVNCKITPYFYLRDIVWVLKIHLHKSSTIYHKASLVGHCNGLDIKGQTFPIGLNTFPGFLLLDLLQEKVDGTFHLSLGSCIQFQYLQDM